MHTQTILPLRARLILLATLLAVPFTVLAVPSPVTNIEAWERDGQVHVRWQKLPDEERIAYYRIFFSSQSILGSGGLYEDFDIADGSASEHVFAAAPAVPTLYVSILAVNDRGEESASFVQETSVQRSVVSVVDAGGVRSTPSTEQPPDVRGPGPEVLTVSLLRAEALSSTGVLLTFSEAVDVRDEDADVAFTITDGSGAALAVTHLVIAGNSVTIETAPQVPGKVYQLSVQNVFSERQNGVRVTLDPNQGVVLFAGFAAGESIPTEEQEGQPQPEPAQLVSIDPVVRLHAEAQPDGRYAVRAEWEGAAGAAMVLVSQTTDHGATFTEPQVVPGIMRGVRITGVPPGELGVRVQVAGQDDTISQGTISFILLGTGAALPAQVTPPSSVPVVPSKGPLSRTGIGMTAAVLLAGVGAGFSVIRRRRRRATA